MYWKNKTKLISILIILIVSILFSFTTTENHYNKNIHPQIDNKVVYVCGGNYAKRFHSYSTCKGLNNCKGGIYKYENQKAAIKAGYSYCLICWQ